jgi:hypothetical protein
MVEDPNPQSFEVNARPDAQSMTAYRQMALDAHLAVAEFIDNSITSALNSRDQLPRNGTEPWRLNIDISIDGANRSLAVSDNAAGIARADIERALIAGRRPPSTGKGLSVYGLGMKIAAFKLGDVLEIETHPLGDSTGWRMELDLRDIGRTNDALVEVVPIPHRGAPGTTVTVRHLDYSYSTGPLTRELSSYLPSIYRSFVEYEPTEADDLDQLLIPLVLTVAGHRKRYSPAELLKARTWPTDKLEDATGVEREWKTMFEVSLSSGKTVSGWVGILKTLSAERSGFFLHYRGRGVLGIAPDEQMSKTDVVGARSTYKPSLIFGGQGTHRNKSLVGEFDVSAFPKGATTNSIEWTTDEENEFLNSVLTTLKDESLPIYRQADKFRRNAVKADKKKKDAAVSPETKGRVLNGEVEIIEGGSQKRPIGTGSSALKESGGEGPDIVPLEGEKDFTLLDSRGSLHQFSVAFVSDASRSLLDIDSRSQEQLHRVLINDAHPAFVDMQPLDENSRLVMTRFALALASSDVFTSGDDRSILFRQINDTFITIAEGIGDAN